jgi:hypothetical protein
MGDGSGLAVTTDATIDAALITEDMAAQVQIIGERNLGTASRT